MHLRTKLRRWALIWGVAASAATVGAITGVPVDLAYDALKVIILVTIVVGVTRAAVRWTRQRARGE